MLNITTLRSPRRLALAAAFALATALPGAGLLSAAHASPAVPQTTLTVTNSGPAGSASGAQGTYTLAVKNDPAGVTALNPELVMFFLTARASVLSSSAPGATCTTSNPVPELTRVDCTAPALAVGAELDLSVTVMFTGATGVSEARGASAADNAVGTTKSVYTTVVAQSDFGGQAPGPLYPGSHGFGGGNG